jgi:hypothetical protein
MLSNATYYTGNNGKVERIVIGRSASLDTALEEAQRIIREDGFQNSVRDWIEDEDGKAAAFSKEESGRGIYACATRSITIVRK